jgi:hypothetical protein
MAMILPKDVKQSLFTLLTETFEGGKNAHGTVYLDRNTGLFTTIDDLSAEQASSQVTSGATIAAHVQHTVFYLEVIERYMHGNQEKADWAASWRLQSVDDKAWDELKTRLRTTYRRISDFLQAQDDWDERLESGYDLVIHTAYHLGAIRQMIKLLP